MLDITDRFSSLL